VTPVGIARRQVLEERRVTLLTLLRCILLPITVVNSGTVDQLVTVCVGVSTQLLN